MIVGCGHPQLTSPPRGDKAAATPAPVAATAADALMDQPEGALLPMLAELRPVQQKEPTKLTVEYAPVRLNNRTVFVRTYNGGLVGPTLRAKPGETLLIDLVNKLPPDPDGSCSPHNHGGPMTPDQAKAMNHPHRFNCTNLHVHGMHVRPDYPSRCQGMRDKEQCGAVADNVLVNIGPGKSQRYEIEIPRNHPPGTHWYHAHTHGAVAMQLASGMAGALIIEGGLDDVPEIKRAKEQVMVFQQLTLSDCGKNPVPAGGGPAACSNGSVSYESCDAFFQRLVDSKKLAGFPKGAACVENFDISFGPGKWAGVLQPKFGDRTSINGEMTPRIEVHQGELQRWRMVHAGIRETLMLGLVLKSEVHTQRNAAALQQGAEHRIPMQVVAYDGIATGKMQEVDHAELDPGYRLDALVRIDNPGVYALVDLPTAANASLRGAPEQLDVLAWVHVKPSADTTAMPLPSSNALKDLAPYKDVKDDDVTGCQYNTYNIEFPPGNAPPIFEINGKPYGEGEARRLPLGAAEEWVVNSQFVNHPHHIHVNPFQIVDGYGDLPRGTWKDTLLVKQGTPVRLRSRYEDFTGKFVLHCHILDHEDQGMMQDVAVVGKEGRPTSCPRLCEKGQCAPGQNICASPPPPDGKCPAPRK